MLYISTNKSSTRTTKSNYVLIAYSNFVQIPQAYFRIKYPIRVRAVIDFTIGTQPPPGLHFFTSWISSKSTCSCLKIIAFLCCLYGWYSSNPNYFPSQIPFAPQVRKHVLTDITGKKQMIYSFSFIPTQDTPLISNIYRPSNKIVFLLLS